MSIIKRIFAALQPAAGTDAGEEESDTRVLHSTWPLIGQIERLAEREGMSPDEMAVEVLRAGIAERVAYHRCVKLWHKLTPKEKEVAAYVCWGMSNEEIGERLFITRGTVRTHVRHILQKFGVENRQQVQEMLHWWDFEGWVEGGGE